MAEPSCGASVQGVAVRVAVLEQDGVPLPGAGNLYVTDALTKMDVTPDTFKGVDIATQKASGDLCVVFRQPDTLKRYNLALELCTLDPELEQMLVGGLLLKNAQQLSVGATSPKVGLVERPNGVSLEIWSRHVVNGDQDATWPYIQWIFPRCRFYPDKATFDVNAMPRLFQGYTSENPNWYNGPGNDWTYDSTRSFAYAYTKSVPTPVCGATVLNAS